MTTVFLLLGNDPGPDSKGNYNRALHETAIKTLSPHFDLISTDIEQGWNVAEENKKFLSANHVIFQFPVFWYMPPARMKKYLDEVYQHGSMFGSVKADGTAGLLTGHYMLSATWNAPADHFGDSRTFFDGITTDDTLVAMRKTQEFVGLKPLPHFHCHDVCDAPDIDVHRARYSRHLQNVFDLPARVRP